MAILNEIYNVIGLPSGDTYFDDLADTYGLVEEGLYEAALALPKSLMVEASTPIVDPENIPSDPDNETSYNITLIPDDGYVLGQNDIILSVERLVSENTYDSETNTVAEKYLTRFAKQVLVTEKHRYLDQDSIYFATNWSPVFWFERDSSTGGLTIYGAPLTNTGASFIGNSGTSNYLDSNKSAFKIYRYVKKTNISSSTSLVTVTAGIPQKARDLVYRIIAVKLIDAKISQQAIEEEDTELFGLLVQQKTILEKNKNDKLEYFREMYK